MNSRIYLDNAATTRIKPQVLEAMMPYLTESYGNPSSVYSFAQEAKKAVDLARTQAADLISANPEEIYFTSGGTEANNWALIAVAEQYAQKGKHILVSSIEHHSVLHTASYLEKKGFEVTVLPVDEGGTIKLEELKSALQPDTILISVMTANNEIGTIQPVAEIGEIAHQKGIIFHTDAVQAYGHIPIHVGEMNIDLLSASAHKLHGPKGIGVLYIKNGLKIPPFLHGGAQERRRRAGTLNVPGIVGMGKAAELARLTMKEQMQKQTELRDYLVRRVLGEIPGSSLNGHASNRLPGHANFSFCNVEGESLLILLDMGGISASAGSACTSGSLEPSHVLLAIGVPENRIMGSIRFSLSGENKKEEIDAVVDQLKPMVERLQKLYCEQHKFEK